VDDQANLAILFADEESGHLAAYDPPEVKQASAVQSSKELQPLLTILLWRLVPIGLNLR